MKNNRFGGFQQLLLVLFKKIFYLILSCLQIFCAFFIKDADPDDPGGPWIRADPDQHH